MGKQRGEQREGRGINGFWRLDASGPFFELWPGVSDHTGTITDAFHAI